MKTSIKIFRRNKIFGRAVLLLSIFILCTLNTFSQLNPDSPIQTVRLVFIHHSTGEGWLRIDGGELITALNGNNYYVRDTNYDWGPLDEDVNDGVNIGSHTDIGHWYNWFLGPHRDTYLNALYSNNFLTDGIENSGTISDPGGENTIIMFKSCFTAAQTIYGDPTDPPISQGQSNPIYGKGIEGDTAYTVSNIKGLYRDLLDYFATRQDKLFILITTPPSYQGSADEAMPKLRAINRWLVEHLLDNYPHKNVFVFDYYNVLTSNGGDPNANDFGSSNGSHHRYRNGNIEHIIGSSNYLAYPTWDGGSQSWDNHPTAAGHQKATGEFVPLLNIAYNNWKSGGPPKGHIVLNKKSVDFAADSGQALPPSQTFKIINKGNAAMNWTLTKTNLWMSLNPTNGTTASNDSSIVSVNIRDTKLSYGVYHDEIVVTSGNADNSPQKIVVNYTIRSSSLPHIVLDKPYINFTADSGSVLPGSQIFTIRNTGSDLMDWTITNHQSWLDIDPVNGETNPGGSSPITLSVNTTELSSGTYRDTLTVSSSYADNSPQFVIITFTVNSISFPHITCNTPLITFLADTGGVVPLDQTFTLSNTGGGVLNWSDSHRYNWMDVNPTNGAINAGENMQVTVSVATTQLSPQIYIDSIFITSPNADNSPQHIEVTYRVVKQNHPPMNFSIIEPSTQDTLKLTNPTKSLFFQWHRSIDPDAGTEVSYTFRFFGNGFDTTFASLSDTIYAFDIMKRLKVGTTYLWCVLASDGLATTSSDTATVITSPTVTSVDANKQFPDVFKLYQNYPNPFREQTVIGFRLAASESRFNSERYSVPESRGSSRSFRHVTLKMFDALGREVATLIDDEIAAGSHTVQFEIRNLKFVIPSGIYFYQLKSGSQILTKSMMVEK